METKDYININMTFPLGFSLGHGSSVSMDEEALMSCTAASQQGAARCFGATPGQVSCHPSLLYNCKSKGKVELELILLLLILEIV